MLFPSQLTTVVYMHLELWINADSLRSGKALCCEALEMSMASDSHTKLGGGTYLTHRIIFFRSRDVSRGRGPTEPSKETP